jgi:Icc protein
MKLSWLTDIHLNFLRAENILEFAREVESIATDAVVITGDIAEALSLVPCLRVFKQNYSKPIYFLLGNHDFYGGSFELRKGLHLLEREGLHYLTTGSSVPLSEKWCLIGEDGWYDARSGSIERSRVVLSDFTYIKELLGLPPVDLKFKLHELALEATTRAEVKLRTALTTHSKVVLATHVPPFPGAAWHQGKPSDADWQPFMSSITMGKMLVDVMHEEPDKELLVLCGHTHSPGVLQVAANLRVLTGGARYGSPSIAASFDFT